ncbi:MAG TPA: DMT family transporter [Hyphomicrobiaceae bacterium]|nr:DMT family transporter [Hyphomicrobiaceae bacterium]
MSRFLRSQVAAYFLLPLAAASWAGNHALARAGGGHVPPASISVARWIIVALAVLPFALPHLRADWALLRRRPWPMVLLAVTGGGVFGTLQFVALHFTTALNMGVVGSVAPVFIVAASFVLFRERLTALQLLGVVVSLSGVVAIVCRLDLARLASFSLNGGDLLIIVNMVFWAIYCACLHLRPPIHPASFLLALAVIAGLGNVPFAALEHAFGYPLQATELTLWTALYAAFVTTLLAYLAWNRGVDIVGAPRASAFLHTVPVFSALFATSFLGERIEPYHIAGFALILAGVTLAARPSERQRAAAVSSRNSASAEYPGPRSRSPSL